jgi:hypothetical protein
MRVETEVRISVIVMKLLFSASFIQAASRLVYCSSFMFMTTPCVHNADCEGGPIAEFPPSFMQLNNSNLAHALEPERRRAITG